MTDSVANLITALKERDICKLVNLQAHGVGDSFSTLFFAMRWMVKKSNMSYSFKDHESAEQKIKASGLKYVLARPTRFTDGPAAPIKFYGNSGKGIGSFAGMSRKSAAVFLVDAAEKADWDETSPVMSN